MLKSTLSSWREYFSVLSFCNADGKVNNQVLYKGASAPGTGPVHEFEANRFVFFNCRLTD